MIVRPLALVLLAACRGSDGGARVENDTDVPVVAPDTDTGGAACPAARDDDGDGWDRVEDGGSDCNDADPGVSPTAEDAVVDGLDADCDGIDGPATEETCVPTGPEDCDGVDDDCDGAIDDPYAVYVAGSPAVVAVGRLLADGAPAVVVGDTSGAAGVDGAVVVYNADGVEVVRIAGTDQSPTFGQQIATGRDLTGDGVDDLVVAAPFATVDGVANQGRIFVFAGPLDATTTLDDAVGVFVGGELDGQPGTALALAPDLTGDGRAELLVGYYRFVLLFSGAPPRDAGVGDAFATWERNTGGGAWTFATAPDVDGDGRDELVLGMATANAGVGFVGRWDSARVATGGVMGAEDAAWDPGEFTGFGAALARVDDTLWALAGGTAVRLDAPDAHDDGNAPGVAEALDFVATGLADGGDLDGDGASELLVATESGVVALSDGDALGTFPHAVTLQTDRALAPPVDVDGDGVPDPALLTAEWAAALDGALGFAGLCDADGDGVGAAQGDCDDGDATVTPVVGRELCNGVDDDCDGVVDGPSEVPLPTRAVFAAALGDADRDGYANFAALDAGGLVTAYDANATQLATVSGGRPTVPYPFAGAGDTDGDGLVELLVSGADGAWLLPATVSGDGAALARATIVDGTSDLRDGRVGTAGDRDGDGLPEVWLGVRTWDGALALAFFDAPTGTLTVDDADAVLVPPASWDTYEVAAARPGERADLDGDGRDDLLVGNPRSAYGDGRAFVFLAANAGRSEMDTTAAVLLYGESGEALGGTLAIGGDLDGDGVSDALLGGTLGVRALGGGAGCPALLGARWDVPAEGIALADLDGDGRAEVWLADDDAESGRGAIYRAGWGESPTLVRLGQPGEGLGAALWTVGDTDGYGGPDLVWRTATGSARVGAGCR